MKTLELEWLDQIDRLKRQFGNDMASVECCLNVHSNGLPAWNWRVYHGSVGYSDTKPSLTEAMQNLIAKSPGKLLAKAATLRKEADQIEAQVQRMPAHNIETLTGLVTENPACRDQGQSGSI
jgi:hypothetical protein